MMTREADKAAFLNRIIEVPDEDTPRLVFADWLDENDEPERAEFIRLQMEYEDSWANPGIEDGLYEAAADLIDRFETTWAAGILGRGVSGVEFRRGFIEEVRSTATAFVRRGAVWAARTPLRSVRLTSVAGRAAAVAACEHLAAITDLGIFDNNFSDRDLRLLAASPWANAVRRVQIGGCPDIVSERFYTSQVGSSGIRSLARAPFRALLESLDVETESPISTASLNALFRAGDFPDLWDLRLCGGAITDNGAHAVAGSPGLRGLEFLDLSSNAIGNSGLVSLIGSRVFRNLESLDLSDNHITARGVERLARITLPPRLYFLVLGENPIGPVSIDALVQLCQQNPELFVNVARSGIPVEQQAELRAAVPDTSRLILD